MKSWTRSQAWTYAILLISLLLGYSQALVMLVYSLAPSAQGGRLQDLSILLYGFIYFLSFPLIVLVIRLNRDNLQPLNMDKAYIVILSIAGAIGLYLFPYNVFSAVALVYAIYLLFVNSAHFGIADPIAPRIMLLVTGVFLVALMLVWAFLGSRVMANPETRQAMSSFITEIVPLSIFQEAVFRGMLFMFLKDLQFGNSSILLLQALIFWTSHINYVSTSPVFFWLILPLLSLTLGYITLRTRSLTPSTLTHVLFNFLAGLIQLG